MSHASLGGQTRARAAEPGYPEEPGMNRATSRGEP